MFKGSRRGVTLIELIVVLGVMLILIAVGVATLSNSEKAQSLEAGLMLKGIAEQVMTSDLEGKVADTGFWPDASPGSALREMPDGLRIGGHVFKPDGKVRCSYAAYSETENLLYLIALCDIDGDGRYRAMVLPVDLSGTFGPHTCDGLAGYRIDAGRPKDAVSALALAKAATSESPETLNTAGYF